MQEDFEKYKEEEATRLCLWSLCKDLRIGTRQDTESPCWWRRCCRRAFKTKSALSVHFYAVHERIAGYRKFVKGTYCRACETEFWTTGRLEDHLRATTRCAYTGHIRGAAAADTAWIRTQKEEATRT